MPSSPLEKKNIPISFSTAMCRRASISLHPNRFHLFKKYINQLLMIQPVILTVGRKIGGRLSVDDKSTDFFDM